jgi:hypothetical protein
MLRMRQRVIAQDNKSWSEPLPADRVAGNVYRGLASYTENLDYYRMEQNFAPDAGRSKHAL